MNTKKFKNLQDLMSELIEKTDELADGSDAFKDSIKSSIDLVKVMPQHLTNLNQAILKASTTTIQINKVEKKQAENVLNQKEELLRWE